MKKLLAYISTPIHLLAFAGVLIIFHPLQWLSLRIGGYSWHKKVVDYLNFCVIKTLLILGTRCTFTNQHTLPTDRPLIVVSNHQSLYDIPAFFWYLRKHHVKFISKIELSKGIPSISFNLRHGGSVLIDRKNPKQSIPALEEFGQYIEANNYAACIFPEGTRSRNGAPREFNTRGLKTLIKHIPSALIVPVTVNNAWKLQRYGWFPMSFGENLSWFVHPPLDPNNNDIEKILSETERLITSSIHK